MPLSSPIWPYIGKLSTLNSLLDSLSLLPSVSTHLSTHLFAHRDTYLHTPPPPPHALSPDSCSLQKFTGGCAPRLSISRGQGGVFDLATHFYELRTQAEDCSGLKRETLDLTKVTPDDEHVDGGPAIVCRVRAVCHSNLFIRSDVNECLQSDSPCGPHSICINIPGRARCSCLSGFSSPTGNSWILGSSSNFLCTGNIFQVLCGSLVVSTGLSSLTLFLCPADVDECLTARICPDYSNCSNSVGSYSCTCQLGFTWNGLACEGLWHLVLVISHVVLFVLRTEPKALHLPGWVTHLHSCSFKI